MRLPIPLAGNHGIARSQLESNQVTENLYAEITKDGKNPVVMYRAPGLVEAFTAGVCRSNGALFDGDMYFVAGSDLYKIDTSLTVTSVGTITTASGRVSIVGGQSYLMLVDGTDGYTWDGTTFAAIADTDFPANTPAESPTHVTYKDGFYVVTCENSPNFYVSEFEDATSWDGLDVANASARTDNLLTPEATDDYLYLLGEYSTEVWYNAGNPGLTFARAQGGVSSWGLEAEWSVAEGDNSIFFLGRLLEGDSEVIRMSGIGAEVISTPEISTEINKITTRSDAFSFIYKQQSHQFYVLSFPTGGKTFVFDVTTGLWSIRSSAGRQWRAEGHAYFNNKHYVGGYQTNQFYEIDLDTYTDAGDSITCKRVTAPIHKDYLEVVYDELILDVEGGVGDSTDPTIMMRYSDDGGKTWSDELWAQIGAVGNYKYKAHWYQLGASYERIFEFKTTDSFFTAWLGCYARVRVSQH